jgi:hypothetical protein
MKLFCHSERSAAESKNLSTLLNAMLWENECAFVRSLTTFGMTAPLHHVRAA